tara:strand:+ start:425 stop:1792 length:1368 start_codon:yes stop_codon:yes gene_type:complete
MGLLDNQTPQAYYNGNDYGDYQFVSLADIINQFMFVYVGEDKIISKASRTDVAFHAQRALAELSFDTLKSCKAQEITVPASLQMTLPQDYVNYTKISWVDSAGIKHLLYPTSKTSNPSPILQNSDSEYAITANGTWQGADGAFALDDIYEDIGVGFTINSPLLTGPAMVSEVYKSDAFNATLVVLVELNDPTTFVEPLMGSSASGSIPLSFAGTNGSLLLENESTFTLETVIITTASNEIEQVATSIPTELKVGMKIVHAAFPNDTIIEHLEVVGGSTFIITASEVATADSTVNDDDNMTFTNPGNSTTWSSYKSGTPSENQDDYQDDTYWPLDGSRYGLDPQHAQANGSFYIDCVSGKIHFSSNISGKTVILDYISDSLGTDDEMQVHKFAEEAMYKWIAHAVLSGKSNIPEYQVNRFKKERFAAIRTAKLRLSSLKLEELTQILRGKSKWIKH